MSQNNSVSAFQGFSVYQPSLGATLQWLPALGTQDLDEMVTAFLPGPASIQDKRAHISMDFFEYARQTGQNFKFYPVTAASLAVATDSPTSTTMYDSGYNSGFNTSPVASDLGSWTHSPVAISGVSDHDRSKSQTSARKPASYSSQRQAVDFSGHPGMRIMTKDGLDVTISASRGAKTKEQRDHAHLMRIIKACDSCKRKKTKCDPSHKKRSVSQAAQASQTEAKPTKRSKKTGGSAALALPLADSSLIVPDVSHEADDNPAPFSFEDSCESLDDLWSKFVQLEPEPFVVSHTAPPQQEDYDFFFDLHGHFSPSSGSSATSPSQAFTPFSPLANRTSPASLAQTTIDSFDPSLGEPSLPYLNPRGVHGTNYVDFDLYSPVSDFLDEELQPVEKKSVSPLNQPTESPSHAAIRNSGDPGSRAVFDSSDQWLIGAARLLPNFSPEVTFSHNQRLIQGEHAPASQPDRGLSKLDSTSRALRPLYEKRYAAPDKGCSSLTEASSALHGSELGISSGGLSTRTAGGPRPLISTENRYPLPTLPSTESSLVRGAMTRSDTPTPIQQTTARTTPASVSANAQIFRSANADVTRAFAGHDFNGRVTGHDPLDIELRIFAQGSISTTSALSRHGPSRTLGSSQPSGTLSTTSITYMAETVFERASLAVTQSISATHDARSPRRSQPPHNAISAMHSRRETTTVSPEQSSENSQDRCGDRARGVVVDRYESQHNSHISMAGAVREVVVDQAYLTVSSELTVTYSSALHLLLSGTLALTMLSLPKALENMAKPSGEVRKVSSTLPVVLGLFAYGLLSSLLVAVSHSQDLVIRDLSNIIPIAAIGTLVALCTVRRGFLCRPSADACLRVANTFRCSITKLTQGAHHGGKRSSLGPVGLRQLSGIRV